jgi:GAF domain-containing protein
LGEFGRSALQTRDIAQILQRATELCAQGLETRFSKVLEYMPDDKRLLVRAGIGWGPGTVGQVSLGVDLESPAGYAFQTGQNVISNHLQEETRFRTPKLLLDHGIRRAINVLIARGGEGHCLQIRVKGIRYRILESVFEPPPISAPGRRPADDFPS